MIKHPHNRYERLRIKKVKDFEKDKARRQRLEQKGLSDEPLEIEVGQDEAYPQAEGNQSVEGDVHIRANASGFADTLPSPQSQDHEVDLR